MRLLEIHKKYMDDIHHQMCTLEQGDLSVAEYTRKFKELRMKCGLIEDKGMMIAQFKHGLNLEIRRRMPQRSFINLEDVIVTAYRCEEIIMSILLDSRRLKIECQGSLKSPFSQNKKPK